jgi:transcription initiation factor TFIID TATA-box-binding protein
MKKRTYTQMSSHALKALVFTGVPHAQIHNIVSTCQIVSDGPRVDLVSISRIFPFTFYDKKRFAAITIRLWDPGCTALLFTSGKLVITGGTSWYECVLAAKKVTLLLESVFIAQRFWVVSCEIQNIVAKTSVPLAHDIYLDIECMYQELNALCTYQKTMFPGLIFRPVNSPVVLLCFSSGKIVITGGKTVQDVNGGWAALWPTIEKYIRKKPSVRLLDRVPDETGCLALSKEGTVPIEVPPGPCDAIDFVALPAVVAEDPLHHLPDDRER